MAGTYRAPGPKMDRVIVSFPPVALRARPLRFRRRILRRSWTEPAETAPFRQGMIVPRGLRRVASAYRAPGTLLDMTIRRLPPVALGAGPAGSRADIPRFWSQPAIAAARCKRSIVLGSLAGIAGTDWAARAALKGIIRSLPLMTPLTFPTRFGSHITHFRTKPAKAAFARQGLVISYTFLHRVRSCSNWLGCIPLRNGHRPRNDERSNDEAISRLATVADGRHIPGTHAHPEVFHRSLATGVQECTARA